MATEATDILSLADAKLQLRADDGIADVDNLVTQAVKSAVGYIEKETGLPLIERQDVYEAPMRGKSLAVIVRARHITAVTEVKYWQTSQEAREEPTGDVPVANLGRRKEDRIKGWTLIWPPADGWPDMLGCSLIRFTVTRSYELNESKDEHLRQAIILMTRNFYDQPERFESDFAVNNLIRAWKF